MDKLRDVMAFLTKYGFWISCGLLALVVLGLWYHTTGVIHEETVKNQNEIKSQAAKMNQVRNTIPHPNAATEEKMTEMLKKFAIDIGQGWDTVYSKQKRVLVWPKSLGDDFERAVRDLRPIEEKVPYPTPPNKEIRAEFRQRYRDWIQDEIPKLADKIKADWSLRLKDPMDQQNAAGGYRGEGMRPDMRNPNAAPVVSPYLVDWDAANQGEIMQTHFGFTQTSNRIPSTLDVLYAQETLWVLDALVGIIKEVNGDVEARYQTSIHRIESIQVGRSAGGVGGTVIPVVDLNPVGGPGAPGEEGSALPVAAPPPMEQHGEFADAGGMIDPAAGRYVDQDFKPLDAARLRAAVKGESAEDVVLAVAKRMPVRLRLKMDQRKMDVLLAACGNSPLPLEVRQVRVNRSADTNNTGGGGGNSPYNMPMRGGGLSGEGMGSGPGYPGAGYAEMGRGPGTSSSEIPGSNVNEITIEVFGIVYIYNPANVVLLGIEPKDLKAKTAAPVPANETTVVPAAVAEPLVAAGP